MEWNYRWIRYTDEGEELFLHEVYYNEDDTIATVSLEPVALIADNPEGIQTLLAMIGRDSQQPILEMPRPKYEKTI